MIDQRLFCISILILISSLCYAQNACPGNIQLIERSSINCENIDIDRLNSWKSNIAELYNPDPTNPEYTIVYTAKADCDLVSCSACTDPEPCPLSSCSSNTCQAAQTHIWYAYIECDMAGTCQNLLVGSFTNIVYPNITALLNVTSVACGPSASLCMPFTELTIVNSLDNNGGDPDYSNLTNTGTINFSIDHSDGTTTTSLCTSQAYSYDCTVTAPQCAAATTITDGTANICTGTSLQSIFSFSDWITLVETNNVNTNVNTIKYGTNANASTANPPNGMTLGTVHNNTPSCLTQNNAYYAYWECTADPANITYELISTFNLVVYPLPDFTINDNNTAVTCSKVVVPKQDCVNSVTVQYRATSSDPWTANPPVVMAGQELNNVQYRVRWNNLTSCLSNGTFNIQCACPVISNVGVSFMDNQICEDEELEIILNWPNNIAGPMSLVLEDSVIQSAPNQNYMWNQNTFGTLTPLSNGVPMTISGPHPFTGTRVLRSSNLSNGQCDFVNSSNQVELTINPYPEAQITTTNQILCIGQNALVNVEGTKNATVSYAINRGGQTTNSTATIPNSGMLSIPINNILANTTFSISSSNFNGCTANINQQVTFSVRATPVANLSSTDFELCQDNTLDINIGALPNQTTVLYYKINNGNSTAVQSNNGVFSLSNLVFNADGQILLERVEYANNPNCARTLNQILNVDFFPALDFQFNVMDTICKGGNLEVEFSNPNNLASVNYSINGMATQTHNFANSGNGFTIATQNMSGNSISIETSRAFYNSNQNCSWSQSQTDNVVIKDVPVLAQVQAEDNILCDGQSTTIVVQATPKTKVYYDNLQSSIYIPQSGMASFSTGSLSTDRLFVFGEIEYINAPYSCENSIAIQENVEVLPLPTAPQLVTQTICAGESSSYIFQGGTPGGIVEYIDENGNSKQTDLNSQGLAEIETGTLFSDKSIFVERILSNTVPACTTEIDLTQIITVNPLPSGQLISSAPAGTVCQGDELTLRFQADQIIDYTYLWSNNSTSNEITETITDVTSFEVTVTDVNTNCQSTFSFSASNFNETTFKINKGVPNEYFCEGDSALQSLKIDGDVANEIIWTVNGNVIEEWQRTLNDSVPDESVTDVYINDALVDFDNTANVNLSFLDANGCPYDTSFTVIRNPTPRFELVATDTNNITDDNRICSGSGVNVNIEGLNYNPQELSFAWSDGLETGTDVTRIYTEDSPIRATGIFVNPEGEACLSVDEIEIEVYDLPQLDFENTTSGNTGTVKLNVDACMDQDIISDLGLSVLRCDVDQFNFDWDLGDPSDIMSSIFNNNDSDLSIVYASNGDKLINVSVTDLYGCQNTIDGVVDYDPSSCAIVETDILVNGIVNPENICVGDVLTIVSRHRASQTASRLGLMITVNGTAIYNETSIIPDNDIEVDYVTTTEGPLEIIFFIEDDASPSCEKSLKIELEVNDFVAFNVNDEELFVCGNEFSIEMNGTTPSDNYIVSWSGTDNIIKKDIIENDSGLAINSESESITIYEVASVNNTSLCPLVFDPPITIKVNRISEEEIVIADPIQVCLDIVQGGDPLVVDTFLIEIEKSVLDDFSFSCALDQLLKIDEHSSDQEQDVLIYEGDQGAFYTWIYVTDSISHNEINNSISVVMNEDCFSDGIGDCISVRKRFNTKECNCKSDLPQLLAPADKYLYCESQEQIDVNKLLNIPFSSLSIEAGHQLFHILATANNLNINQLQQGNLGSADIISTGSDIIDARSMDIDVDYFVYVLIGPPLDDFIDWTQSACVQINSGAKAIRKKSNPLVDVDILFEGEKLCQNASNVYLNELDMNNGDRTIEYAWSYQNGMLISDERIAFLNLNQAGNNDFIDINLTKDYFYDNLDGACSTDTTLRFDIDVTATAPDTASIYLWPGFVAAVAIDAESYCVVWGISKNLADGSLEETIISEQYYLENGKFVLLNEAYKSEIESIINNNAGANYDHYLWADIYEGENACSNYDSADCITRMYFNGREEQLIRANQGGDPEHQTAVVVRPNPALNKILLDVDSKVFGLYNYHLRDVNGKRLLSGDFIYEAANGALEIDITHLAPGAYFITVFNPQLQSFVEKIVKI